MVFCQKQTTMTSENIAKKSKKNMYLRRILFTGFHGTL